MESTAHSHNRTGSGLNPGDTQLMLAAVRDLSPPGPITTDQSEAERLTYITEADSIGSVPPPLTAGPGAAVEKISNSTGVSPSVFFDKLGERIAFERGSTRLYEALIAKYTAVGGADGADRAGGADRADGADGGVGAAAEETELETLRRIRSEELSHFRMLSDVARQLGADPTAETPCADVIATASMGLLQVVCDPRTTLEQSLNAVLTAELTDNAGWELLTELAKSAGLDEIAERFAEALADEEEHQAIVTAWLRSLVTDEVDAAV
jgi:hypothetical protein